MELQHGWMPCRACHDHGQDVRQEGDWHLRANPGYWGASSPKILVLGFSKGANQIAAASAGEFDGVAFAGIRTRLRTVLDELGIDLEGQSIDEALSSRGKTIGAASLIRCGLSMMEDGKLVSSGTIMPKAAKAAFPLQAMKACIREHLDPLPSSVEAVVLLGTTPGYVKGVKGLMKAQFADYQDINELAFRAQGRTWVFASHPSGANGTFGAWVAGDSSNESGRKKHLAQNALSTIYSRPPQPTPPKQATPMPTAPATKPSTLKSATTSSSSNERFAKTFHLRRHDGRKVVPVMMKNRDTGVIAFRVAKMGNTKESHIEVTDESELLRYCESGLYQVRARPLDKSEAPSLVRPILNHSIVKAPAA